MRIYFDDASLKLLDDKAFTNKVHEYLKSHIKIEVNKRFNITLFNYYPFVTDHASEFIFQLEGVPEKPLYWDLNIGACSEINIRSNMLKMKGENDSYSSFKLNKENDFHVG